MADNLAKQPKKGILKNSSSFETSERQKELAKGTKWDEMNIIATLHPKDKDYGHMKIEEPKTPYAYSKEDGDSGDEIDGIDADLLAQKIRQDGGELPKALEERNESEEEDIDESPEDKEKRHSFESKRKMHYNEFYAVKLARKLMEEDDDDGGQLNEQDEDNEKQEDEQEMEEMENNEQEKDEQKSNGEESIENSEGINELKENS